MRGQTGCIIFVIIILIVIYLSYGAISHYATGLHPAYTQFWEALRDDDFVDAKAQLDTLEGFFLINDELMNYAYGYYNVYLGQYDEAFEYSDKLSYDVNHIQNYMLRSGLYESTGQLDLAMEDLEEVIYSRSSTDYSTVYIYAAWKVAFDQADYEKAADLADTLLRNHSYNEYTQELKYLLGVLSYDLNMARDAVTEIQDRIDLKGGTDGFNSNLAHYIDFYRYATEFYEEPDDALEEMRLFANRNPESQIVHSWLDYYLNLSGNFQEAESNAIEALVRQGGVEFLDEIGIEVDESVRLLDPGDVPLQQHFAAYSLRSIGRSRLSDGDVETAGLCLEKAWELMPWSAEIALVLSDYYVITGEYEKSKDLLIDSMERLPYEFDLFYRYSLLAEFDPSLIGDDDPSPDSASAKYTQFYADSLGEFPDSPWSMYGYATTQDVAGTEESGILLQRALDGLTYDSGIIKFLGIVMAMRGDSMDAIVLVREYEIPRDLVYLADTYVYAGAFDSQDVLVFGDILREVYDPDGDFDQWLDPLRLKVQNKIGENIILAD